MYVDDKNYVITGALSGIGKACVETFSKNNAKVFACVEKLTDEFVLFVNELNNLNNGQIIPIEMNLFDKESIKNAAKEIMKYKIKIDGLLNIAGITDDAYFQMVTEDQIHRVFKINVEAQIIFTQYITKLMIRNGKGSIVFTSSISALDGNIGQLVYSSTKAALLGITKTLSKELGPNGIRVNSVSPGVINTGMIKTVPQNILDEKISSASIKRIGEPEEVANLMMFLSSDEASYITGQNIRIDGGIS